MVMTGAPVFASLLALWGFWALLVVGTAAGELGPRAAAAFVLVWIGGRFASGYLLYGFLFAPFVAILDIALVFAIFKGDVRLR